MATTETTPKERVEQVAAALGLTMAAEFVPWSKSRSAGEESPSLNWRVTLHRKRKPFLTTDYMAGCAHAPSYKQGDRTADRSELVRFECEHGCAAVRNSVHAAVGIKSKPILPDLADVLYSLSSNSDVLDCGTFEEWAENTGYDTDSRKAEAIYRDCLEIALKLRNAISEDGLRQLREACQDY